MLKKIVLPILCMLSIITTVQAGIIFDLGIDVQDNGSNFYIGNTSIVEEDVPTVLESDNLRVHMYALFDGYDVTMRIDIFERDYSDEWVFAETRFFTAENGTVIKIGNRDYFGNDLCAMFVHIKSFWV